MKIKTNNLFGKEILIEIKNAPVLGNYRNPKRAEKLLKNGVPILEQESHTQSHKRAIRRRNPTK